MATTDDIISDAISAIDFVRPAVPILVAEVPEAAVVEPILTMLYEGLISLQAARAHENPEDELLKARAKITEAVQNIAALKFGAMP